jgi:transcriptional regulatory protein RtcR
VREGRFRDDLLARINLWTFHLPGLADRREDIAPNLAYELEQFRQRTGTAVTFSTEARRLFLEFAEGPDAPWPGNFRDLNAVVTRLATLAPGGRITVDQVAAEIATLRALWRESSAGHARDGLIDLVVPAGTAVTLDRFDRAQLEDVLTVCRSAPSLSAAGRVLFDRSRARKQSVNDADRLRKYLARFGLDWHELKASV